MEDRATDNWKKLAKGMKILEDYKHKKKIVIERKEEAIRDVKSQLEKKKRGRNRGVKETARRG